MNFIQIITLSCLCICTSAQSYAQSAIQWRDLLGETPTAFYDTVASGAENPTVNVHEFKTLSAEISDTTGIAQVRVSLGSSAAASDLFVQTFAFSGQSIQADLWFQRSGILCRFSLGEFVNFDQAHLTLEALSNSGAVLATYSGMLY